MRPGKSLIQPRYFGFLQREAHGHLTYDWNDLAGLEAYAEHSVYRANGAFKGSSKVWEAVRHLLPQACFYGNLPEPRSLPHTVQNSVSRTIWRNYETW